MVRERERFVPQLPRPQHQLLDMRGAFEEGEVGVDVEFSVGDGHRPYAVPRTAQARAVRTNEPSGAMGMLARTRSRRTARPSSLRDAT